MEIRVNQLLMYYEEKGLGLPVIFLHGYPFDHTIWDPMLPFIDGDFRLITPDLRGFGKTDAPEGIYSMGLYAKDIVSLMDVMSVDKAVLVGHSMGGYIALAFAQAYPNRLAGLGLIATHAAADSPEQRERRYATIEAVIREGPKIVAESMAPKLTNDPQLQARLYEIMMQSQAFGIAGALKGMAERGDSTSVLSLITVPGAIIAGEADQIVPAERVEEMEKGLPHARLVKIPNAGHMPMMEAPEITASVLNQLLTDTGAM